MKRVHPQKVYYEIKKPLGAGLTSEVFLAIRKDQQGWIEQEVVLKIIRSKKDVHILKQEYEQIRQVQSDHCVRILAWESFNEQPALVLEPIYGVTLKVLLQKVPLNKESRLELIEQFKKGLEDLHGFQVFHGDLNLSNIMVNCQGLLKIIDFGFGSEASGQMVTPQFASKNRLAGHSPQAADDWVSFRKIKSHLLEQSYHTQPDEVDPLFVREHLGQKVSKILEQTMDQTQRVNSAEESNNKRLWVKPLVFGFLFAITLLNPWSFSKPGSYHSLDLRSQKWFEVSINGLPYLSGPIFQKKLRSGTYQVHWRGPEKDITKIIELKKPRKFLLQPRMKSL